MAVWTIIMFSRNSLSNICAEIIGATIPFMTIGFLGDRIVLYISLTVGIVALLCLVLSILLQYKIPICRFTKVQPQDFSYPYVIALSTAILKSHGIDASFGYWFALGLCVLIIISITAAPPRQSNWDGEAVLVPGCFGAQARCAQTEGGCRGTPRFARSTVG